MSFVVNIFGCGASCAVVLLEGAERLEAEIESAGDSHAVLTAEASGVFHVIEEKIIGLHCPYSYMTTGVEIQAAADLGRKRNK